MGTTAWGRRRGDIIKYLKSWHFIASLVVLAAVVAIMAGRPTSLGGLGYS